MLARPLDLQYARAVLLGIAFSCNLGGMMTPIASMQNMLAMQQLNSAGVTVNFGGWGNLGNALSLDNTRPSTALCKSGDN